MSLPLPHTITNIAGEKLTFLRTVIKDGKEYLEAESEVQPNAGPPMHVHHQQNERINGHDLTHQRHCNHKKGFCHTWS